MAQTLTLSQTEQAVADEAAVILAKAKAVIAAVTGSPLTAEAEKLIPGLAGIVGKLAIAGATAGAAAAAIPIIEEVIGLYKAGIIKGADWDSPVRRATDDSPYTGDPSRGGE